MEPRGLGKENTGWSEVGNYGEGIMVASEGRRRQPPVERACWNTQITASASTVHMGCVGGGHQATKLKQSPGERTQVTVSITVVKMVP